MLGIGLSNPGWRRTAPRQIDPAVIAGLPGMWSWSTIGDGLVGVDGSGNAETLLDRSGNGRTFGGTAAGLRPAIIPGALNGKSAIRFDGGDGLIYQADHPTAAYSNLIVFRSPPLAAVQTIFGQTTTSQNNHRIYLDPTTLALRHQVQNAALLAGDTNASAGAVAADLFHVAIATFDGAAGTVKAKRDAESPTVLTKPALTGINNLTNYLGCGNLPSGVPSSVFRGDIADIIIMSVDILAPAQAASLAKIRDYYSTAFGLAA